MSKTHIFYWVFYEWERGLSLNIVENNEVNKVEKGCVKAAVRNLYIGISV